MIRTAWAAGLFCAVILGCGSSVETDPGEGGAGGGQGGGGQGGNAGGCTADNPCAEGSCIFTEASCAPGTTGTCQNGFSCDGPATGPVCGCDGIVIEGEYAVCSFWGGGKPYSGAELCAKGMFACGNIQCKRHVQFCQKSLPGPQGDPSYGCVDVATAPGTCSYGISDCACLDTKALGCFDPSCCSSDQDNQETVTIALP